MAQDIATDYTGHNSLLYLATVAVKTAHFECATRHDFP